ncbi:hypothetical protein CEXT_534201 [Caerostris extrusa]|uniref:Uncharacterized protein n=1 Tax=Caerostris extrusa TaxID=172846 RepID=A0AAV4QRE2_CAEEX|nr:hypothetical protein CEXT_534201 [Caerostris extrusa]
MHSAPGYHTKCRKVGAAVVSHVRNGNRYLDLGLRFKNSANFLKSFNLGSLFRGLHEKKLLINAETLADYRFLISLICSGV